MDQKSPLQRVKTEREFILAMVKTGIVVLVFALLIAMTVTWFTTRHYDPIIHYQALRTAFLLPVLIVPACIGIIGRQNLHDHRYMLEATRLAHTDEMTGLANRRSFWREAKAQLAATDFESAGICAFIVDLDHFKAVNDKYGHSAGDDTLIHVAAQMEAALPDGTLIARLGGEEFAILLEYIELSDIHDHAEILRDRVAANPCLVTTQAISVTVSVGIGIASSEDTISSLLSRADRALYVAKDEGRNRFSIAA